MIRLASALSACLLLNACGDEARLSLVTPTCSIDSPRNDTALELGKPFAAGGWAFDKVSGTAPEKVFLQLVSEDQRTSRIVAAARGTKRPDVAQALGAPGAVGSGFDATIDTAGLAPGKYTISIVQAAEDKTLVCAGEVGVNLK